MNTFDCPESRVYVESYDEDKPFVKSCGWNSPGFQISKVNGYHVHTFDQYHQLISCRRGKEIQLTLSGYNVLGDLQVNLKSDPALTKRFEFALWKAGVKFHDYATISNMAPQATFWGVVDFFLKKKQLTNDGFQIVTYTMNLFPELQNKYKLLEDEIAGKLWRHGISWDRISSFLEKDSTPVHQVLSFLKPATQFKKGDFSSYSKIAASDRWPVFVQLLTDFADQNINLFAIISAPTDCENANPRKRRRADDDILAAEKAKDDRIDQLEAELAAAKSKITDLERRFSPRIKTEVKREIKVEIKREPGI